MAAIRLRNDTDFEFVDISSEVWREYTFNDGNVVHIEAPLHLSVTESGHRILTQDGLSHFVPTGWVHLAWKSKDGEPHFVL